MFFFLYYTWNPHPAHTVLALPKITPFTFGDEAVNSGETVSVQCTIAGGDLPAQVTWTMNGRPLESYLEIITEKRGKRINNLMIDSVSAKHAGNYTCTVENGAGSANHSAELIVIGLCFIDIIYEVYFLLSNPI